MPASAVARAHTLRAGTRGPAVLKLQDELEYAGLAVPVDGVYGTSTVRAVARFQRATNLGVTGVADSETQRLLRRDGGVHSASVRGSQGAYAYGSHISTRRLGDRIPLRRGMSGHDVHALQGYLRRDHVTTSLDGQFGPRTLAAVRRWERREHHAIDGVVDAGDIATLRADVDGSIASLFQTAPTRLAPGDRARVGSDGLAAAPENAPDAVKQIIAAGNAIASKPYHYGGGHGRWKDSGYDCSGSVSYALHGARLLNTQLTSGDLASWGAAGAGQWVTIYANGGHVFMVVAGLRFDTSGATRAHTRWQRDMRSGAGYTVRHPVGL